MNSKPPVSNYEAVDLGLPSGVKWAKMNLGASSETEAGLYYTWGGTDGYVSATDKNAITGGTEGFDQASYNASPAASITGNLSASNDAATVNLGSPWRMPTKAEYEELISSSNTDREWTTIDGKAGYKFMKKSDHSVYVFIPAFGYWYNKRKIANNTLSGCWTATKIYQFDGQSSICHTTTQSGYLGFPIRPVQ